MSQPTHDLQRLDPLPDDTSHPLSRSPVLKGAGPDPLPCIAGDFVRMNAIDRGKVANHAAHQRDLGLRVMPAPPAWWIGQNGVPTPLNAGLAFGAEIALIPADLEV